MRKRLIREYESEVTNLLMAMDNDPDMDHEMAQRIRKIARKEGPVDMSYKDYRILKEWGYDEQVRKLWNLWRQIKVTEHET